MGAGPERLDGILNAVPKYVITGYDGCIIIVCKILCQAEGLGNAAGLVPGFLWIVSRGQIACLLGHFYEMRAFYLNVVWSFSYAGVGPPPWLLKYIIIAVNSLRPLARNQVHPVIIPHEQTQRIIHPHQCTVPRNNPILLPVGIIKRLRPCNLWIGKRRRHPCKPIPPRQDIVRIDKSNDLTCCMLYANGFASLTCFKRIWIDFTSVILSYFKCAVGRAAVCNNNFDISLVVLVVNGLKTGRQCFSGVICRGNDGNRGVPVILNMICLFDNRIIPPEALN